MAKRENLAKKKKQLAKSVSTATDSMKTRMFESKIRKKPYEATEGKMYPEDKLKKLISKLISGQRKMEQEAAIEFMEYQEEIALAISNTPDLSQTDVMDKVIENIQKDQHAFFMKLEREGRSKQLKFLIKSGAVPKNMQERAEESLVRVDPKMAAQLKGEKAKKKIKRQKLIGATPV
ncbi:TPA: hypothetical protein EYP38_04275, partial [Candidatus Micrarchaeota archaeon]|nr:hypothetical protein [Candidatus Micrarchaeota archaeon]